MGNATVIRDERKGDYYGWGQERSIMLWILWMMGARAIIIIMDGGKSDYHYYGWRHERSIMLWILWIIHNLQLLWMRAGVIHNSTIIMDERKGDPLFYNYYG